MAGDSEGQRGITKMLLTLLFLSADILFGGRGRNAFDSIDNIYITPDPKSQYKGKIYINLRRKDLFISRHYNNM